MSLSLDYRSGGLVLILLQLWGCSTLVHDVTPPLRDELITELEVASEANTAPLPEALQESLLPSFALALPPSQSNQQRFDIAVDDVPAQTFFLGLVEGTPDNIIVSPQISQRISLTLKNVTVEEVLQAVRDSYGIQYRETNYGYQILPASMQTEIFQLDYLDVRRVGSSQTRVSSGQISDESGNNNNNGNNSDSSSNNDDNNDNNNNDGSSSGDNSSGTQITTSNETDFWSGLENTLAALIGGVSGGRTIATNAQAGLVIVRAMPDELQIVREFLQITEVNLQRQVILEAKILEVELNDGYQTGIDWSALATTSAGEVVFGTPSDGFGLDNDVFNNIGGSFFSVVDFNDFSAVIQLLNTQGTVQVLSSPQVSTINNQKAVIKVGTDEFFVTDVSTESDGQGAEEETTTSVSITPFFSGIALDVIPQIGDDDVITLHVHPSISEVSNQDLVVNFDGRTLTLPLAASTIRETDSIVRAQSGQIVLIGGLIQSSTREEISKIPALGDLPLLGKAFQQTLQQTRKSELVILLRPVIANQNSLRDQIDRYRDNLQQYPVAPPLPKLLDRLSN